MLKGSDPRQQSLKAQRLKAEGSMRKAQLEDDLSRLAQVYHKGQGSALRAEGSRLKRRAATEREEKRRADNERTERKRERKRRKEKRRE